MTLTHVLLVEDDSAVREALAQTLDLNDLSVVLAGSFVAAKDHIRRDFPGIILSDIRMPGRDGFHLLAHARQIDRDLPVILLTGEGDIPMAVSAMEQGAFDFLEKPCASDDLLAVLHRALQARHTVLAARAQKAQAESGDPAARMIFGVSEQAEALRAAVRRMAQSDTEVLITGDKGTGVSKVAEVIHLSSPRAQAPFEKRAASGLSRADLAEAIRAAKGGALFLDEIGQLPADTQIALIEALEAPGLWRLMAGSNVDLEQVGLNPDLYYRLVVSPLRIPSLSERPEDIPVLFRFYVAQASEQAGVAAPEITHEHQTALMAQDWPGNARALMSAAMRFVLGMPQELQQADDLGLAEQMARVEKSLLVAALEREGGQASAAAKVLKLPRKTFYDKLAKHGIRPEVFRR